MKIRKKVFIIISLIFLFLLIISSIISDQVILKSFNNLELEETNNNLTLLERTIEKELDTLSTTNGDWAAWDDTYKFIRGEDYSFIERNSNYPTFLNLAVNSMLFFDNDKKLFYDSTIDLEAEEMSKLSQNIIQYVIENNLFIDKDDESKPTKGIILVEGKAMALSSWPILDSAREEAIEGRLIMLKFYDEAQLEYLGTLLDRKIILHNTISQIPNSQELINKGLLEKKKVILTKNNEELTGFLYVGGLDGQQYIILEQTFPRSIYKEGRTTIFYYMALFFVFLFISGTATLLFLHKSILQRISKLSSELKEIKQSKDFSKKVSVGLDDEISVVQQNINDTLLELEKSMEIKEKSEKELNEKTKALEKVNKELEETLDDFYTMRIGMQEDLEKGILEEENMKIKKKLNQIKKINKV